MTHSLLHREQHQARAAQRGQVTPAMRRSAQHSMALVASASRRQHYIEAARASSTGDEATEHEHYLAAYQLEFGSSVEIAFDYGDDD